MAYDLNNLKKLLNDSPEVTAAYLFGSAVGNGPVVNDLDFLILLHPEINIHSAYLNLTERIAKYMGMSMEKVDIIFFDLQFANPDILYKAVNNGILLKNESPSFLAKKIEELSNCFLANEFLIQDARQLSRQRLEEFYAD